MKIEDFISKIKEQLGDLIPSDLIFKYDSKKQEHHFYNESTPNKNSILGYSEIKEPDDFEWNIMFQAF